MGELRSRDAAGTGQSWVPSPTQLPLQRAEWEAFTVLPPAPQLLSNTELTRQPEHRKCWAVMASQPSTVPSGVTCVPEVGHPWSTCTPSTSWGTVAITAPLQPEFVKEDFFKNQATLSECEVNRWSFKNKLACPSPKETSGHAPA